MHTISMFKECNLKNIPTSNEKTQLGILIKGRQQIIPLKVGF
jgi:hypothetical protein